MRKRPLKITGDQSLQSGLISSLEALPAEWLANLKLSWGRACGMPNNC